MIDINVGQQFAEAVVLIKDFGGVATVAVAGAIIAVQSIKGFFGFTKGPETNVGETNYIPTGKMNPETGEEFYRQEIYNFTAKITFADIFNKATFWWVNRKLNKAAKKCTAGENPKPMVFAHLPKVTSTKTIGRLIVPKWKSTLGETLANASGKGLEELEPGQVRDMVDKFTVLIYEPGAKRKEFRTLVFNEAQIFENDPKKGGIPALENILFKDYESGEYKADPTLPQADRWRTNNAIRTTLRSNRTQADYANVYHPVGVITADQARRRTENRWDKKYFPKPSAQPE